jgi:hypothetical protein
MAMQGIYEHLPKGQAWIFLGIKYKNLSNGTFKILMFLF